MFDVQTGQATQIAAHDAPIKCVKWIDAQGGILATGSWDKTIKVRCSLCANPPLFTSSSVIKYWDTRQSNPVAKVDLPERCYTMDVSYPLLVVGTAERHIQMFNLNNPTTVYRVSKSFRRHFRRVTHDENLLSEYGFTIKMANARDILFYHCKRIRCG